jgi:hypothetical protein
MREVVRLNESQLNKIVNKVLLEEQVYTNIDKSYDYKKINNVWFAKNKKGNKWMDISKYPDSIKAIESKLKTDKYQQKVIETLSQKDKINVVKGFQMFMNKYHKGWYKGSILPAQKLGILDDITKSNYLKFGVKYKKAIKDYKSNLPWYSWEHITQAIGDVVSSATSAIQSGLSSVVNGFTNFFRKMFPNVAELFFARDLTTDDFTDSQKKIMYTAVQNAMKRNKNNKVGATEYVDYGGGVEKDWFGVGGVKASDMVFNTLFSNPKFMVATTLGRFSYKNLGNKIVITDTYDFKKIPDAKTTPKELEGLSYPQKVMKIKNDNNVGYYVAIRHLGYLEHPDTGLDSKPKINIELNPQDYA